MKKKLLIKTIALNAIICALYVVLSLISGPLAFLGGSLQFRLSELLNLLVFFNPLYSIGVTLGCFLTNLISLYGWPDLVVGTLATLITTLLIIVVSKTIKKLLVAAFVPAIINALIIPFVVFLYDLETPLYTFYWTTFMFVGLGELIVVLLIGYPVFLFLIRKTKTFGKIIFVTQNEDVKW